MSKASFVYVTYIAAPAEKVFEALRDPAFTRQYWNGENRSDWKAGSRWEHHLTGEASPRIVGTVVECTPPRKLVLSWAAPGTENDPGQVSRATLEVEPLEGMVLLRVTHEDLVAGSPMLEGISGGWPRVFASLKSLLEAGRPLPAKVCKAA
jgi:uncharacterized protein YndB with AHSA1/START domain